MPPRNPILFGSASILTTDEMKSEAVEKPKSLIERAAEARKEEIREEVERQVCQHPMTTNIHYVQSRLDQLEQSFRRSEEERKKLSRFIFHMFKHLDYQSAQEAQRLYQDIQNGMY